MRIQDLSERIGARIVSGEATLEVSIDGVCAGDRISDLLAQASSSCLLVTNLVGPSLLRVAELMDVPAICLVGGMEVEPVMKKTAEQQGLVLLVSPCDMFETCGRLYRALKDEA
ncbi:MAG: hypothetical protein GXY85_05435 [Candidatus Brocadiaceae bacterium]|mgnify:CR=1 FL=1|nr:hypothetical protein [Candidatus Brocadiaceae bacterium]